MSCYPFSAVEAALHRHDLRRYLLGRSGFAALKRYCPSAEAEDVRVLAALALLIVALVVWEARRELSLDHRLSGVASEIAGRQVSVDCPGFLRGLVDINGNGGTVMFDVNGKPSSTTHLETSVCRDLSAYGETRKRADFACVFGTTICSDKVERAVYAALVLSHESQHLRGSQNEGATQCYAIQTLAQVAGRLGSPPAEARAVAAHFLAVSQPSMSLDYTLPDDCVDGGSLDLNPQSSSWPTG
jgi:hypothetical protein